MIQSLIKHLRDEWCIVTTNEKKQGKALFYEKWDQVRHITTYQRHLDKQQKQLKKLKIVVNDSEKVQHVDLCECGITGERPDGLDLSSVE